MNTSQNSLEQHAIILYYIRAGLYGNAISHCEPFLNNDSNNNKFYFWKAFILAKQAKLTESINTLTDLFRKTDVKLPSFYLYLDLQKERDSKSFNALFIFISYVAVFW